VESDILEAGTTELFPQNLQRTTEWIPSNSKGALQVGQVNRVGLLWGMLPPTFSAQQLFYYRTSSEKNKQVYGHP